MGANSGKLIDARGISIHFGGVAALTRVSIDIADGEIYGLVGPNGAGKTTLLNAINGVFPLTEGNVVYRGRDISRLPLHTRAGIGIGRTFQGVELFPDLNVLDNILLGTHVHSKTNVLTGGLFFGPARREEIRNREMVEEIIEFFELERYRKKPVGTLSFGSQKLVGLARAMATKPQVLLLDEVASGLNREEKEDLARFLLRIKYTRGIACLLVEHDVRLVSDLADRVMVLDYGRMVMSGEPDEVLRDPIVKEVFVGRTRDVERTNATNKAASA